MRQPRTGYRVSLFQFYAAELSVLKEASFSSTILLRSFPHCICWFPLSSSSPLLLCVSLLPHLSPLSSSSSFLFYLHLLCSSPFRVCSHLSLSWYSWFVPVYISMYVCTEHYWASQLCAWTFINIYICVGGSGRGGSLLFSIPSYAGLCAYLQTKQKKM